MTLRRPPNPDLRIPFPGAVIPTWMALLPHSRCIRRALPLFKGDGKTSSYRKLGEWIDRRPGSPWKRHRNWNVGVDLHGKTPLNVLLSNGPCLSVLQEACSCMSGQTAGQTECQTELP